MRFYSPSYPLSVFSVANNCAEIMQKLWIFSGLFMITFSVPEDGKMSNKIVKEE
ncbi:hypothetical protein KP78_09040 [Jeotgalibacillus soli]|uniref:Uncharacterized protein n=1 Tax=Jeotgalibacillus soli TaxID=889306 RepID=A0A0C2RGY9_9BACL|nr:hypothetical protein KP78_09040 [Jeotgalibacillus soli]